MQPSLLGTAAALRLGRLVAAANGDLDAAPVGPAVRRWCGAQAVVSSAFDGDVGLAHHTVLAAALGAPAVTPVGDGEALSVAAAAEAAVAAGAAPASKAREEVAEVPPPLPVHGLGTYRAFALAAGGGGGGGSAGGRFVEACVRDDTHGLLDPLAAQELLATIAQ